MSEPTTHRRTMLVLAPAGGNKLDAGELLAILREVVEPHPANETHLWGSGILRDNAPPTASVEVNGDDVTLTWSSDDVEQYYNAYESEKEHRAAIKREQEDAKAADGTSDSV